MEILSWFLETSWGSLYLFLCCAIVVRLQQFFKKHQKNNDYEIWIAASVV